METLYEYCRGEIVFQTDILRTMESMLTPTQGSSDGSQCAGESEGGKSRIHQSMVQRFVEGILRVGGPIKYWVGIGEATMDKRYSAF